jgi:hypothetical protein
VQQRDEKLHLPANSCIAPLPLLERHWQIRVAAEVAKNSFSIRHLLQRILEQEVVAGLASGRGGVRMGSEHAVDPASSSSNVSSSDSNNCMRSG